MSKKSQEIYEKMWEELPEYLKEEIDRVSKKHKFNEEKRKKLIERVYAEFVNSRFEAAEAIGILTAQSISEPATQMTMRTYHVAGSVGLKVTLGLPRLIEIFDARKELETPSMTIYLKSKYNTEKHAVNFANKIIEKKIENVAEVAMNLSENSIEIRPRDPKYISIMEEVIKKRVKKIEIHKKKTYLSIEPKKELTVKELRMLKERIAALVVDGVKGIENAIVIREGDDWIVQTFGSNLAEILEMEEVDHSRTYSNNPHEIAKVLGIEAARTLIIEEAYKTMQEQGLDVDIRFLSLVADIMTFGGDVKPIGRYGVAGKKESVLARAAFEETTKHLTNAAVKGAKDHLKGLFENLMIGNLVPAGTGKVEITSLLGEEDE